MSLAFTHARPYRFGAASVLLAVTVMAAGGCTTKAEDSQYFGRAEPPKGQVLR
jgi:hypothetical protein